MLTKKIKVLFLSAEAAPLAKVGGLADVANALPKALRELNVDIRIMMPLYGHLERTCKNERLIALKCHNEEFKLKPILENLNIEFNNAAEKINVYETLLSGNIRQKKSKVPVYLIENQTYFGNGEVYNPDIKFLFFSHTVINILEKLNFPPDIIHCNDNHTALIPALIKAKNIPIRTITTIHNLEFQGKISPHDLKLVDLSTASIESLAEDAKNGDINRMVQGILTSDLVTTVSPTYSKEILTSEYGQGLDNILKMREKNLYGIINGIDTEKFNPATDPYINSHYSNKNIKGKTKNKEYLLKTFFPSQAEGQNIPIIGLISRLTPQKGVDLLTQSIPLLIQKYPAIHFIILGTGIPEYEAKLTDLTKQYPNNLNALIKFDLRIAQEIYAGSDMFFMPSRFEPCGLTQLIAMRYGAVPIVRKTGGLADTIIPVKNQELKSIKKENGFMFEEYTQDAMVWAIEEALIIFKDKKLWKKLMMNGMRRDSSWKEPAKEYLKLYKKLLNF